MKLKIGTRGSKLALTQTKLVIDALKNRNNNLKFEVVEIKTLGDKKQGTAQAGQSDKRDWIHELEVGVINGDIDFAVHSGKDVPAEISEQTELLAVLKRANPFDAFIGKSDPTTGTRIKFKDIPKNGVIGTASLRRRAQVLMLRPDLSIVPHRGNVTTRLEKLEQSNELSGIILASAGIERLGLDVGAELLTPNILLPAINQGTLVVQIRRDRSDIREILALILDPTTVFSFIAERTCVSLLPADCKSALSIFATVSGEKVKLATRVLLPDGSKCIKSSAEDLVKNANALGLSVARDLLEQGAAQLLEESRKFALGA